MSELRLAPKAGARARFKLSNRIALLALFASISQFITNTTGAEAKPFQPADYPESTSKTYTYTLPNSKVSVEALQVKRLNEKHSNPRYCRAWVTITKDGKKVSSEYFEDINGLGGPCGLYFPQKSISDNYKGVVKLGDYDGRLLLVNNAGKYWNIPGGSFFTSKDKKLLFSTHECDAPAGIAVFDLQKGATIFQTNEKAKEAPPVVSKWYFDGTNYFFTSTDPSKPESKSKAQDVYVFDTKISKLVKKMLPPAKIAAATPIAYDFSAMSDSDIKAADQGMDVKGPTRDAAGKNK